MTLDEVKSITPERPVSDAEMREALRACLDNMAEARKQSRAEFTPEGLRYAPLWHAELSRIMATYAPYFARLVLEAPPAA